MSDSTAQAVRQLKIKTGVVKRLFKEEASYREEVATAEATLERLKSSGADGADVRNAAPWLTEQERVVKDTEQMVPRTRRALEDALVGLEDLVEGLKAEPGLTRSAEFQDALAAVEQVQAAWKTGGN